MPFRYSRVHRLLKIITLVQSGRGWNASKLAEACGTVPRTIYRDLNMLEGAGIPYYLDEESGGYRIRSDFFMPPVELTLEEALAILCLAERIGADDQIPFTRPAARAAVKIRGQLPAALRDSLETVSPHVEIQLAQAMPAEGIADVYELVRLAIARRRFEQWRARQGRSRIPEHLWASAVKAAGRYELNQTAGYVTQLMRDPHQVRMRRRCR